MDFDKARLAQVASFDGLREVHGKALILAQEGYSKYGIAEQLGVGHSTAKKYLDDLQDEFGEKVTMCKPKEPHEKTWPDESGVTDY